MWHAFSIPLAFSPQTRKPADQTRQFSGCRIAPENHIRAGLRQTTRFLTCCINNRLRWLKTSKGNCRSNPLVSAPRMTLSRTTARYNCQTCFYRTDGTAAHLPRRWTRQSPTPGASLLTMRNVSSTIPKLRRRREYRGSWGSGDKKIYWG
jgi:hypothetical protein